MSKDIQTAITELITKGQEIAPVLANEILSVNYYLNIGGIVCGVILILISIFIGFKLFKGEAECVDLFVPMGLIFSLLGLVVSFACTIELIKIIYSPNTYIIQTLIGA
jgi:cation transporter-like permease